MQHPSPPQGRRQSGLTLIELMLTLVLTLLLLGGLASTFVASRQGVKLQQAIAITNDLGRAALEFVGHDIQMAGYREQDITAVSDFSVIPAQSSEGGANPDSIALQYETDFDCRGQATPTYSDGNNYTRNLYQVINGSLTCTALNEALTAINATPLELVSGVEDFQILYGENTNGDGIPDVYVRQDRVSDWNNVVAAQVAIQLASAADAVVTPIEGRVNLLNQGETTTPDDGAYRTVVSSTFLIRNRLE